MAKSLGQIHSANFQHIIDGTGLHNLDVSGVLTRQLSTMIRQGNMFKVVGVDMTLSTVGTLGGGQITGYLRYFAPTKGRCAAYRGAFAAMRNAMKNQGINVRDNRQYDFRVGFNGGGPILAQDSTLVNQATLDGDDPLDLVNVSSPELSVFDVHNRGVQPITDFSLTGGLFSSGFNTLGLQTSPTDFVLNDGVMYSGNSDFANTEWENIPFMLSWTPDTTDMAVQWNWRPDPALYLAVMTGQFQINVEEVNFDGQATELELNTNVMISGWSSIMKDPSKKRRKSRKSKPKKRRSKK